MNIKVAAFTVSEKSINTFCSISFQRHVITDRTYDSSAKLEEAINLSKENISTLDQ